MKAAVDASALLAIFLDEPDAGLYLSKLLALTTAWISPVNWWEVQIRVRSLFGESGEKKSAAWIQNRGLIIEPVTLAQAQIAAEAFSRYQGKPARLNLGDCFAYALARAKGVPLLYKGDNFRRTDVKEA